MKQYIGYVPKHELPIQRGDYVKIPKGTLVRRIGTRSTGTGEKPAGRSFTVKVAHILSGSVYPGGKTNPSVVWAGSGGYWAEVDINDVGDSLRIGAGRYADKCETPETVTCGNCHGSWCERCDPAPSALCHTCHGRGFSEAEVKV